MHQQYLISSIDEHDIGETYTDHREQRVYRFHNNYGASVVRRSYVSQEYQYQYGSYGHFEGLWELAVIAWEDETEWHIAYDTPITEDVLGWLSEEEVDEVLGKIRKLRKLRTKPVPKEEPAPALEPEKFNNLLDWFQTEPADMMGIANTGLRDSQRK